MPITLNGTTGEIFPTWTTGTRPSTPSQGQTGYNTTLATLEVYDGTNWRQSYLNSATAQASTSGTSIDFTSIPSWVKRITVMLNGISSNGTSGFICQIGTSSGVETTGYTSGSSYAQNPNLAGAANSTTSFLLVQGTLATNTHSGHAILTHVGSNIWVNSSVISTSTTYNFFGGGTKTLSGTLDRVRITTFNGSDAFDAGSINILYE